MEKKEKKKEYREKRNKTKCFSRSLQNFFSSNAQLFKFLFYFFVPTIAELRFQGQNK